MAQAEVNNTELWEKFVVSHTLELKHKIVLNYIWLVKYVLQNMSLPINTILTDEDFLSIGILALFESIDRFEPQRGIKFESYVIPRIKGMIQDELRRLDWLSRTARKKAQDFIQASDILRSEEGREVSTEEIRLKLNVSPEKYNTYLAAAAAAKAAFSVMDSHSSSDPEDEDYIEEIPDTAQENFLSVMENEERLNFITDYIKNLTERKRLVITLYYYENLTFKEIGQTLSVTESRICQIHTQVVNDLRKKLIEFDNA